MGSNVHKRGVMYALFLSLVVCAARAVASVAGEAPASHVLTCQARRTAGLAPRSDSGGGTSGNGGSQPGNATSYHDVATTPFSRHAAPLASARTYLFLLGFPDTGTTAASSFLESARGVSTFGKGSSPNTEGWAIAGLKSGEAWRRWGRTPCWTKKKGDFREPKEREPESVDWSLLNETYHKKWNLRKPVLLEKSPPEILHAADLDRTFSPGGDVRFLVLVRGVCNTRSGGCDADDYAERLRRFRSIAERYGPDRVFLLRYEDLCFSNAEVGSALERWLPGLAGVDAGGAKAGRKPKEKTRPRHRKTGSRRALWGLHASSEMSIPEYCRRKWLPDIPYSATMRYARTAPADMRALLAFFDYAPGDSSGQRQIY